MDKLVKAMSSFLGVLATLATLIMMIAIFIDVVFRTLYDRSMPGVLEISETALVAAVFLGLAYTGATNSHVAVDLLTERLPKQAARWVMFVAWVLTVLTLALLLYATFGRALQSTQEGELRMGLIAWPLYPSRWIIVIGLAAMLIVAIVNVIYLLQDKDLLGVDPQMTQTPEHPYEYVTLGSQADDNLPAETPTASGEDLPEASSEPSRGTDQKGAQ